MFQSPFDLLGEDTRSLLQLTSEDQVAMNPSSSLAALKEPITSFTFDLPALPPVVTSASVTDGAATPQSIATPRTTPGAMAAQQQCNEVNLSGGLLPGDASPRSHFGGLPSGMRTTTPSPCGSAPVDDNDLLSNASTQELELLFTLLQQTQALQNRPSSSLDQYPSSLLQQNQAPQSNASTSLDQFPTLLDIQSQQLAALALQQNNNNININNNTNININNGILGVQNNSGFGFQGMGGGLYNSGVGLGVQNGSGLQMGGGFGGISAPVSPTISALTAMPNFNIATSQPTSEEKYKTEICKLWEKDGWCKFGEGCHFAHGAHELNSSVRHPKYKTKLCRNYSQTGSCQYGQRCQFIHQVVMTSQPPIPSIPDIKQLSVDLNQEDLARMLSVREMVSSLNL